jgi:hypothetical protein
MVVWEIFKRREACQIDTFLITIICPNTNASDHILVSRYIRIKTDNNGRMKYISTDTSIHCQTAEEVFWLSGVYEPIMKNALKIQFQMLKNSKNKFSM